MHRQANRRESLRGKTLVWSKVPKLFLGTQRLPIDLGPSHNLVLRPPTTSGVFKGGVGSSIESPRSLWVETRFGKALEIFVSS